LTHNSRINFFDKSHKIKHVRSDMLQEIVCAERILNNERIVISDISEKKIGEIEEMNYFLASFNRSSMMAAQHRNCLIYYLP
jgi:hypothetical protein